MNRILHVSVVAVALVLPAFGQPVPTIPATDARNYIGQSVVVTGRVVQVYSSDRLVRLVLEKRHPKQPLTVVVSRDNSMRFLNFTQYDQREIQVSGRITETKGQPEIVVQSKTQLKLLADQSRPEKSKKPPKP